ncbi:Peptide-N4-(N-acetyl-beta-glucosaminyl)asparagine amidase A [Apostasia shenzhenica]|uniref:Peptide-N4-(N-acetyl-beta-glucosaminyl)asparagine amidase A n=1 Tax=Apostasia shenzhenica TaxID=1088818 RepID=A0A2I0BH31_9ASPA|nr:Peptide-N4-(N-acetyl-beta-glucosaminyl)asparagine amidase A [Apostasia shenzhenica]
MYCILGHGNELSNLYPFLVFYLKIIFHTKTTSLPPFKEVTRCTSTQSNFFRSTSFVDITAQKPPSFGLHQKPTSTAGNNSAMSNSTSYIIVAAFLFLFFDGSSTFPLSLSDRYLIGHRTRSPEPQEYIDPSILPFLPPAGSPACSLPVLQHDFANTYGAPPASASFSPPDACPPPWSRVVLDLSFSCAGEQYDRIAAIWINGAEVLRTSTAEPTESGIFWRVRKDVSRYSPLFRRPGGVNISMMLENLINEIYTGVYKVNVSVEFYPEYTDVKLSASEAANLGEEKEKLMPLLEDPADLIIPISRENGSNGFWFLIQNQSDSHFKSIKIPQNTYRAVLEVYISYHSNDEFWYSNPPNEYIKENNLTTERRNGSFREVFATIDGRFAGTAFPFPVIFTGGINPLFWSPVVAIRAFDLPSYNLDLTPFLELLLDWKHHDIGLGVTGGISYWLIDANLHLWLDPDSQTVSAKLVRYEAPPLSIARTNKFLRFNGTFKIDAERKVHFSGWVNSSMGNLTTEVNQKLKIKSSIEFLNDGNYKEVHLKTKAKTDVKIKKSQMVILSRVSHKFKYPLILITETLPGINKTYTSTTNFTHTLYEEASAFKLAKLVASKIFEDRQQASGWMEVKDHSVQSGSAGTQQTYQYNDNNRCYNRKVTARDGELLDDTTNSICSLAM